VPAPAALGAAPPALVVTTLPAPVAVPVPAALPEASPAATVLEAVPALPVITTPILAPASAPLVADVPAPVGAPAPAALPAAIVPPPVLVPAPSQVVAPRASVAAAPAPAPPVRAVPAPAERMQAAPPAVAAPTPAAERPPLVVDDETAALARKLFGVPGAAGHPVQRVLVCAVDAPELSAEIAVGLGLAASRERSTGVALIDLNLDGGVSLHRRLHLDGTPGISDAVLMGLKGRRNIQRVQPSCDLWLIAAGSRPQDLRARLGQPETRRAIGSLAAAFEYAVGYGPTVGADAIALGECFDGVVLVVDAKATAPDAVPAAAAAFKDGGVAVLGTIARTRPTA
jgi:hypothetical protein